MNILQKSAQFFANGINNIPANLDAEEAIIGGILLDPQTIFQVADKLAPEAFYASIHQDIYKACLALYKRKQSCDLMAVTDYLTTKKQLEKVGGSLKLVQLLDRVVSNANLDRLVDLVIEKWTRRQVIELGYLMVSEASDGTRDTRAILEDLYERSASLNTAINSEKTGDMETWTLNQIIQEFRSIEMTVLEPALKSFKLYRLAKKYGMNRREIESIFYQYLVGKDDEPFTYLSKLREECGDDVNEWFMHGFIPKGTVMLLHALGGIGKSRLTYEFAYRLASGTAWGQFHVTAPQRKVALIQLDELRKDTMRAINDRWIDQNLDHLICHKSKWSMEHIAKLRHEIEAHGIEVIIIDSLTAVNKHNIFTENETEYARPVLMLKEIAEDLGCTFIIVHHSNSEGKSRGTKAIFNSVSLVLSLHLPSEGSDRSNQNRILCIEKSRYQRPTKYRLRYEIDEETHQWKWVCEGEDTKEEIEGDLITKGKILDHLDKYRNILWEAREIYDRIGGSYGDVRRSCYQLANDGLIERRRSQRDNRAWGYFLAWEGKDVITSDRDDHIDDHIMITSNDQIQNPVSISDTVGCDHVIIKNDLKKSQISTEKNQENNDRMITSEQAKPETLINREVQDCNGSDHRCDHRCDHDVIISDRISSDDQIASERSHLETPTNQGIQDCNGSDHRCDHQSDRDDHIASDDQIASDDRIKKGKYRYCGKSWLTEQKCLKQSYLEIVEIQGKDAIVSAPTWRVTDRIPLKDLKMISDR